MDRRKLMGAIAIYVMSSAIAFLFVIEVASRVRDYRRRYKCIGDMYLPPIYREWEN